jgi:hypothetical protein
VAVADGATAIVMSSGEGAERLVGELVPPFIRSEVARQPTGCLRPQIIGQPPGHHEHCTLLTGLDHGHEPCSEADVRREADVVEVADDLPGGHFAHAHHLPDAGREELSPFEEREESLTVEGQRRLARRARPGGVIEAVERRPGCLLALAGVPATGGREESIGRIEADGQYLAERKFSQLPSQTGLEQTDPELMETHRQHSAVDAEGDVVRGCADLSPDVATAVRA